MKTEQKPKQLFWLLAGLLVGVGLVAGQQLYARIIYPPVAGIGAGDITSSMILDGTIVNADVSATAGLNLSKLATSTTNAILVASSSAIVELAASTTQELLEVKQASLFLPDSVTSYTDGGVLVASGTAAFQATAVGTSGQVLTSNGTGNAPTFQNSGNPTTKVVTNRHICTTSFTSISGLTFTPAANTKYTMEGYLITDNGAAASTMSFVLVTSDSATSSMSILLTESQLEDEFTATSTCFASASSTPCDFPYSTGGAANAGIVIYGTIETTSTANVDLQCKQTAANDIILENSWLKYTKL